MIFVCIGFIGFLQTVQGEGVSAIFSAEWNRNYENTTASNIFNTYQLLAPKGSVGRILITREEKHLNVTLLVVVRQPKGIVSFTVPENIDGFLFTAVARTLNPFMVDQNVTVELWSVEPVEFTFIAKQIQDDFAITLDKPHICNASVAQPVYYSVSIPSEIDSIFINVNSNTSMCMTVSVQPYGAPVSDLTSNVLSSGMYQTMSKQSTVAVERDHFPKFFLVFVLEPSDNDCSSWKRIVPATGHTMHSPTVTKTFEVRVAAKMKQKEYLLPMLIIASVLLVILLITLYYMKFEMSYDSTDSERFQQFRDDMRVHEHRHNMRPEDDQSLSGSWDYLPDALDREVVRAKTHLMVADLATKTYEQRNDKYMKYVFYLIIIALFYTLPSVQLVFNAVDSIRSYGNLDLCWYNFRCARPLWNFFAFNNIISNAAYVFLGALLIILTYERNKVYKQHVAKEPAVETDYGLPQHPALTYAIGIAIILEGMLSASYHICPSATNYQFDTSFMYVIALLGKLKIYQLRHPDIIAQAHNTFGVMAGFILIAMIGVRWHSNVVWILFPIVYVLLMALVSLEFYFKGVWKVNPRETWNSFRYAWASSKWCSCMFPRYWGRFIFLLLANIINVVLILLGEITRPADFASYLLIPFIANLFLYLLYYIVMKFSHGERLSARVLILLAISSLCWGASLWFFFHQVSDWSQTPAMSRELNKNCIIVNFFDNHDVWHILSAIAMFISFILLDRIDDDLRFVERHSIPVF